jgi:hypothetical protein
VSEKIFPPAATARFKRAEADATARTGDRFRTACQYRLSDVAIRNVRPSPFHAAVQSTAADDRRGKVLAEQATNRVRIMLAPRPRVKPPDASCIKAAKGIRPRGHQGSRASIHFFRALHASRAGHPEYTLSGRSTRRCRRAALRAATGGFSRDGGVPFLRRGRQDPLVPRLVPGV